MNTKDIHINFNLIAEAFTKYVREKAMNAGGKIVYIKDQSLVEEDPTTKKISEIRLISHLVK